MSFTREQKALEKSWAKVFADEIFPTIDENGSLYCIAIRHQDQIHRLKNSL